MQHVHTVCLLAHFYGPLISSSCSKKGVSLEDKGWYVADCLEKTPMLNRIELDLFHNTEHSEQDYILVHSLMLDIHKIRVALIWIMFSIVIMGITMLPCFMRNRLGTGHVYSCKIKALFLNTSI